MALAFSITRLPEKNRGYKTRIVRITLDTDYPASGWPITAANVGLSRSIAGLIPSNVPGFQLAWDHANLKLWAHAGGTEASVGENALSGLICTAIVIGD